MGFSSDRPNYPDSGSQTERTGKRTWSFHERYANDAEFKRQVDEGRKRAQSKQALKELQAALAMTRERRRIY